MFLNKLVILQTGFADKDVVQRWPEKYLIILLIITIYS